MSVRIALFCHSLRSDWNHGNAHFLRGVVSELIALGHDVQAFESATAWSAMQLAAERGPAALDEFRAYYPTLSVRVYDPAAFDVDRELAGVDLAVVHEWNEPALIAAVGQWRARHGRVRALFHDTHHRSVSRPADMAQLDFGCYDGVLAYGARIRDRYLKNGWSTRVWTWHEAADTRVFRPLVSEKTCDVVWIGNWGDDERTAELDEFLLAPVARLRARADIYGVRYPADALERLRSAGAAYRGWLPNYRVPEVFAAAAVTVHVPRRPYVQALPGIPTIRPFEAMACGIPLVCAPWHDVEGLFRPGHDYLVASSGSEMEAHLRRLLNDPAAAAAQAAHAMATVRRRHTCAHRAAELMDIAAELGLDSRSAAASEGAA